ncbi:MAG: PQQ-dependent sugar dehydrogenase [Planctomycetes bacterium]|nr:PQQ-dependent sugar dehydrogenase [Planctomycetota bacterium]
MGRVNRLFVIVWILSCCTLLFAKQPPEKNVEEKSGLDRRVPWTASHVVGSPDPPAPYRVEPAFPHLTFNRPLVITNAPGTERLFVAEQDGKIFSFENETNTDKLDLVVDLKQKHTDLTAIYGLTFHPKFERNRFVYVCYVVKGSKPDGTKVVRFTMKKSDPPQIDAESEKVIITWLAGGHNGGCLKFGPDGYLYISTGDGAGPSPPDTLRSGQDVSNLLSAILRIDVNSADEGKAYRVPPDNPLVEIDGARPEIWSYGFRNPWKMSFDRIGNDLWVGDVGWDHWEMIYRVVKGGNYGWSIMEGRQPVLPEEKRGPTPILPPTVDHPHSEAASITGGFVYRGTRLKELVGSYIYGDYQSGKVWGLRHDRETNKVIRHRELANTPLQLVAFGEDNAGELYLLDHNRSKQLYRLVENPEKGTNRNFPKKLSRTGLFASVKDHVPAPGVIPYSIIAPHWADQTQSERWLAVPGTERIELDKKGNWQFPDGSVIAKTVSIEMEQGVPQSLRRLETQILHRENESWRPYTYVWNDEQTDALLADADGFNRTLTIRDPDAPAGRREQTYRFASRAECLLCHNPWVEKQTTIFGVQSASLLAVHAMQLNRDHNYDGRTANQLRTYQHIGLLPGQLRDDVETAPKLTNPYDESADLNERARSYLNVNCSHCHQFNAGGAATILLSYNVELEKALMLGVRPTQGTFGISNAKILSPGDPFGSVLYYRIAKLGSGRMPRVGSRIVDEKAVHLFHDWIAQLPTAEEKPSTADNPIHLLTADAAAIKVIRNATSAKDRAEAIRRLSSSTRGALSLLRLKDQGDLPEPVHREIVSLTKNHDRSEVRDLFERFLPESERIKRLGSVVNHAEILGLEADAKRGEQLFFSESAASCKNCHRINEKGETLGPDLTKIGKKYRRGELLKHILEPSQFMEPKYVPYLLETTQGRIYTGLLAERTSSEVVLKDAKNKLSRFKTSDVELLVPQQKSLMPDLLLRDMTRQQVADLLAYLATLK